MDKDLARVLATGGTAAARELERLYSILAEHLPQNENLRKGVASALAEVGLMVIRPAFDACPELEAEFQERLQKYGIST